MLTGHTAHVALRMTQYVICVDQAHATRGPVQDAIRDFVLIRHTAHVALCVTQYVILCWPGTRHA